MEGEGVRGGPSVVAGAVRGDGLEFNSGGEGFKSGWLGIRIRRRGGVRERANKKAG